MMAKTYKITFKPVEPYFFGNEKNFVFTGQTQKSAYSSSYFIRSEKIPSQSTILGALRYIFLPCKKSDFRYSDAERKVNSDAVGEESFDVDFPKVQEFGIIKKISSVFICGINDFEEMVTLIPTPMDHNLKDEKSDRTYKKSDKKMLKYSPFNEYCQVSTTEGKKLYADDFDVKKSIAHSWVSLEKSEIYTEADLFESDLRIGINRCKDKDGFFKKEYCMLRKGFTFAVYAELDIDYFPQSDCVFLGQGKSAFTVTFTEEKNNLDKSVKGILDSYERNTDGQSYPFIYCLSDCFISDFDNENVLFCAIDTKDYRAFKTRERGRIEKGGTLYRLLKAGSMIITENPDEWVNKNKEANAENIGFNTFVILGGKEE